MDFAKTEEQELLLESLDEFLDNRGFDETYFKQCWDENRQCSEFLKAAVDAGFGKMGIPEEFGGTEVDLQTLVLVAERFTERCYPASVITNALQVDDMLTFGND